MPNFSYIACNPKGDSLKGVLQAMNKTEVAKKLSTKGLFLVSCRVEDIGMEDVSKMLGTANAKPGPTAAPTGVHALLALLIRKRSQNDDVPKNKITLKELVVLTRQLSISINAGMSFVDALQGLSQNNTNPKLAYVLHHVLDDVLSGKKFSEALAHFPEVFEVFYVSMAAAGEAGGFMPDALNRIAEFLEKEMELRSKIKSAMIYPMVIALVASVVVTGMMAFIVPTFIKVFTEMNAPLPLPTRMLIHVSVFVRHGGFLLPVAVVMIPIYLKKFRDNSPQFRVIYDERILELPLFGKIMSLEIITRFIRTLASLVENGVAILLALEVARQVVGNVTIEKVVDEIYASVQQGNGISPVLYKSEHFPVLVANMVATGEKTGSIPEVLTKMANYYDTEVATAVRDLLTMMEPLLIVIMAVIVGFVVTGLMLPTFQMSSLVQN